MNPTDIITLDIQRLHTTPMGEKRIRRNLSLEEDTDVVKLAKDLIAKHPLMTRIGKNIYVECNGIRFTINESAHTIITAHNSTSC